MQESLERSVAELLQRALVDEHRSGGDGAGRREQDAGWALELYAKLAPFYAQTVDEPPWSETQWALAVVSELADSRALATAVAPTAELCEPLRPSEDAIDDVLVEQGLDGWALGHGVTLPRADIRRQRGARPTTATSRGPASARSREELENLLKERFVQLVRSYLRARLDAQREGDSAKWLRTERMKDASVRQLIGSKAVAVIVLQELGEEMAAPAIALVHIARGCFATTWGVRQPFPSLQFLRALLRESDAPAWLEAVRIDLGF